MRRRWSVPAALLAVTLSLPARAVETDTYATRTMRWDPLIDGLGTGVLVAGWLVSEAVLKHTLAPTECRWCGGSGLDAAARSLFVPAGSPPSLTGNLAMDTASNVTTFALMPAIGIGASVFFTMQSGASWNDALGDVVLIAEAAAITAVFNQVVKFNVGRSRPFVSDLAPADWPNTQKPDDNHLSFFSGHTSFAVSIAVATGMVASLRGSKWAWLAWATGVPMAIASGVLRMAADKHWLSDVAVGAVVGAAVGGLVPWLHGTKDAPVTVSVGPGGLVVSGKY